MFLGKGGRRFGALLAIMGLSACGGAKTDSGVRYDAKSLSDIEEVCREMSAADVMTPTAGLSSRAQTQVIRKCCKEVRRAASDLSATQRAMVWYDWMMFDDINQTPNQIEGYREVADGLRGDLTMPERMAAVKFRPQAFSCIREEVRARG